MFEVVVEEDVNVVGEFDGVFALLSTSSSTIKRVDEWLRIDLMLVDVLDDDEGDDEVEVLLIMFCVMLFLVKFVIVKCKKCKCCEGKSMVNGLSMRM